MEQREVRAFLSVLRLLVRRRDGVRPAAAGMTLLSEARAVLARQDQAVAAVAGHAVPGGDLLRLGGPIELQDDVLPPARGSPRGPVRPFAFTPPGWSQPLPDSPWPPFLGRPFVKRTWTV